MSPGVGRNAQPGPVARQMASKVTAPAAAVSVRMLSGGISTNAIFIAGQVTPQSKQSATSISLA